MGRKLCRETSTVRRGAVEDQRSIHPMVVMMVIHYCGYRGGIFFEPLTENDVFSGKNMRFVGGWDAAQIMLQGMGRGDQATCPPKPMMRRPQGDVRRFRRNRKK